MDTDNVLTFVVLCSDINVAGLRQTVSSVKFEFPDANVFAMVGNKATDEDVDLLGKYCNVHRGGDSITSLINKGIDVSRTDWNFILVAGSSVKGAAFRKYLYFCRSEKDILYPVIDRKISFDEASINGIMVHRSAFDKVGKFVEDLADLAMAKLLWAYEAIEHGFHFKALVGAKLF